MAWCLIDYAQGQFCLFILHHYRWVSVFFTYYQIHTLVTSGTQGQLPVVSEGLLDDCLLQLKLFEIVSLPLTMPVSELLSKSQDLYK
jgi:hypothetical protein